MLKIVIASDHGGLKLKSSVITHLKSEGIDVIDLGTDTPNFSVDYPDYAAKLANAMKQPDTKGILVCGSGIGMSIAINRYEWIRGALVCNETSTRLSREHNNANVIIFGERLIGELTALSCVNVFLKTPFLEGRHLKRVEKLSMPKNLLKPQEK